MVTLTPKQLNVLKYIISYSAKHSYAPTYREMGTAFGVSFSTIYDHVRILTEKGALEQAEHSSRNLRATKEGLTTAGFSRTKLRDALKDLVSQLKDCEYNGCTWLSLYQAEEALREEQEANDWKHI